MAEIPVERKGAIPWWVWLLGALLLLALLGLLARGCDPADGTATNNNSNTNANANTNANNRSAANSNNTGASSANAGNMTNTNGANATNSANANGNANGNAAGGARVTDVNLFGTTADAQSLVGRGVELENVRVNRVLSDRVFTVTSGGKEMFALLDDNLDSPGGKESQIKARRGQAVNLTGSFRAVPESKEAQDDRRDGDLNEREYRQMKGQRVYLHVTGARNADS